MRLREFMIDTILWFVIVVVPVIASFLLQVSQLGVLWAFSVILYTIAVSRRLSKLSAISLYILTSISLAFYFVSKYLGQYYPIDAYALFFIFPALLGLTAGTFDERFLKHAFIVTSLLQVLVLTDENYLYNGLKPIFAPLEIAILVSYIIVTLGVIFGKLFSRIV